MTTTLDLIRATTAESLEGVRSDFYDLPTPTFKGRATKDMDRIVDATAAERSAAAKARAANRRPAGSRRPAVTVTDVREDGHNGDRCTDRRCCPARNQTPDFYPASTAQLEHITRTLGWLAEVDPQGAADMTAWLDRGNREKLTGGRGGTASALITRIKARTEELRNAPRDEAVAAVEVAPTTKPARVNTDDFADITDGNYAVMFDGKTHFYRITRKPSRKTPGGTYIKVQERASDVLYPLRGGWNHALRVFAAIRELGVDASHLMYAERIGSCWRCNIALTDDTGNPYRRYGLGPDCGPKVMG